MRSTLTVLAVLLGSFLAMPAQGQLPTTPNTLTVSLVPDPVGGRNLLLRVEASEIVDLYGLSFDVKFPKKRLRWRKNIKTAGAFFSDAENAATTIIAKQKPRGTLRVGITRLGELPGVTGSGVVLDIGFVNRNKSGPRELVLSETEVFDSNGLPIADAVWDVVPFQNDSSVN